MKIILLFYLLVIIYNILLSYILLVLYHILLLVYLLCTQYLYLHINLFHKDFPYYSSFPLYIIIYIIYNQKYKGIAKAIPFLYIFLILSRIYLSIILASSFLDVEINSMMPVVFIKYSDLLSNISS